MKNLKYKFAGDLPMPQPANGEARKPPKTDFDLLSSMHSLSVNPETREVFYMGEPSDGTRSDGVDNASVTKAIKNLAYLAATDDSPITLHLMTPGGCVYAGLALCDFIKTLGVPVVGVCHGLVASMGAIILQSVTARLSMPTATLMIHEGSTGFQGTNKQFKAMSTESNRLNDIMLDILVSSLKRHPNNAKLSTANLKRKINKLYNDLEDVYLSPKEALEIGLIDQIISPGTTTTATFSTSTTDVNNRK